METVRGDCLKIRATEEFFDLKANVIRKQGEIFEADDERTMELTTSNNNARRAVCVAVPEKKRGAKK